VFFVPRYFGSDFKALAKARLAKTTKATLVVILGIFSID
jgi:hypothetical protein